MKPENLEFLRRRPRRNRRTAAIRDLCRETELSPGHLVLPIFVMDGDDQAEPVASLPGISRLTIDRVLQAAKEAASLGIPAVALFPSLDESLKDSLASESTNPDGLLQRCIRELKEGVPEVAVISDVAMDPYSSDGHDGLVQEGEVVNDPTLEILGAMAVSQAEAGADIVAPSDMMDGRVGYIRRTLDGSGWTQVGILAYSAKYASAFYGPFREALDSVPRGGDKKTYQMDPANSREAVREILLDIEEGADMVMVKPALAYLDVIAGVRPYVNVPLAAYSVSGEYSMIHAAGLQGWLEPDEVMWEVLQAIKRAGADLILSYYALQAARNLNG